MCKQNVALLFIVPRYYIGNFSRNTSRSLYALLKIILSLWLVNIGAELKDKQLMQSNECVTSINKLTFKPSCHINLSNLSTKGRQGSWFDKPIGAVLWWPQAACLRPAQIGPSGKQPRAITGPLLLAESPVQTNTLEHQDALEHSVLEWPFPDHLIRLKKSRTSYHVFI